MRIVDEKKADPERERRGKPAVKTTLLVVDVKHGVAAIPPVAVPRQAAALHGAAVQVADVSVDWMDDDGDSDDPDKDRIHIHKGSVRVRNDDIDTMSDMTTWSIIPQ